MKKAIITMSLGNIKETAEFPLQEDTKEYMVADEAYLRSLVFANMQAMLVYGRPISGEQMAEFLKNLNYDYEIREV